MVKIATKRKIGYDFSRSADWNIDKGLTVLRSKYHINNLAQRYLTVARELEVRSIQYKRTNPVLSKRVGKMSAEAYRKYDKMADNGRGI
jgi:hypothetical protein